MNAIEFMKEKKRMCKSYSSCTEACPLRKPMDENRLTCLGHCFEYPEKAVDIVERWSAEHPAKTRQSEILKIIPDATIKNGILITKPCEVNEKIKDRCKKYDYCRDCRKEYWLAEIK